jgi:CRP-like cAMP-binding protein
MVPTSTQSPDGRETVGLDRRETVRLNRRETVVARDSHTGSHPGWRAANVARRRQGRSKAVQMLALRLSRYRAADIAQMFGTTREAVYQRLYRLRRDGVD